MGRKTDKLTIEFYDMGDYAVKGVVYRDTNVFLFEVIGTSELDVLEELVGAYAEYIMRGLLTTNAERRSE